MSMILLEVWFTTHSSGTPGRIASNNAAATRMEEIGNWPRQYPQKDKWNSQTNSTSKEISSTGVQGAS